MTHLAQRKVSDETINRYIAGKGYIEAAKMIATSPHYNGSGTVAVLLPMHMLAAFSLELLFKAWLLGCGQSSKDVRSYSHKVKELFEAANQAGLPPIPHLNEVVDLFAGPHADFTYRYLEAGTTLRTANWLNVFPILDQLDAAVDSFIGASAEKGLLPGH